MSKKYPADKCCVVGCKNNNLNLPGTKFYSFSIRDYKKEQTLKWIKAVGRECADGTPWKPNKRSRICSRHFIGNKKSDHPLSPNFVPTLFPPDYYRRNRKSEKSLSNAQERFVRAQKRTRKKIEALGFSKNEKRQNESNNVFTSDLPEEKNLNPFETVIFPPFHDQAVQTHFPEEPLDCAVFVCSRNRNGHTCEAETQAQIPPPACDIKTEAGIEKNNVDESWGESVYSDEKVGLDPIDNVPNSSSKCSGGFHGFRSLTEDQDLLDLAGVNLLTFERLLNTLSDCKTNKITKENRLLIFLFKMKLGLTYSSIGVLFGVHRSTVSRIFYTTLRNLAQACQNFVQWPSKESIQSTMPTIFKENYPNCRVIIDCIEFKVEQPPEVPQRAFFYSDCKKCFTIKILVGCTPNGLISFVSKCFGGRTTDDQITNLSGFLHLLEPGDLVLADKSFPEIRTGLDDSGKGVVIVMPPFVRDNTFSLAEAEDTRKVANIRTHIERIMQRIKTYRITSKFAISELPYMNNVVFMVCVLVNLQPPILKNENDEPP